MDSPDVLHKQLDIEALEITVGTIMHPGEWGLALGMYYREQQHNY
jgi:hypothetical protein